MSIFNAMNLNPFQTMGWPLSCLWEVKTPVNITFFSLSGPGNCEIRDRRILHGFGEKSPPQCSADGEFLPVQCKFVNTTDMMVFDLIHSYNR